MSINVERGRMKGIRDEMYNQPVAPAIIFGEDGTP